ncbi:GNAT family N-acetyltransferase [Prescottella sp. R16]|uniref:GNAT family N-acetyltransferase n=1 Tax=Prescottella sp. R16 TaxID=3064529 RepID=UPI00272E7842|nr:GNAT family N-acetyltransferase [Prescottella sp. R16]
MFDDTTRGRILDAMERNCASHASHLHPSVAGARVLDSGDLVVADSGLADDTFNLVCRARFTEATARARVDEVIAMARTVDRPFSWWVAPTSTPADLGTILRERGLSASETEEAMVAVLADVPPAPARDELTVVVVDSVERLCDYASLVARNWSPPSPEVVEFHERAAHAILADDCASRFVVGYLGDEPVAGAEVHFDSGLAGLYGVVTLDAHRRQGFGTAVTLTALDIARSRGTTHAVLQASADGAPLYEKIGFTTIGTYTEYAV